MNTRYPIFDDLMWDTDYYPAQTKAALAHEITLARRDAERIARARRLRRKRSRREWAMKHYGLLVGIAFFALFFLALWGDTP